MTGTKAEAAHVRQRRRWPRNASGRRCRWQTDPACHRTSGRWRGATHVARRRLICCVCACGKDRKDVDSRVKTNYFRQPGKPLKIRLFSVALPLTEEINVLFSTAWLITENSKRCRKSSLFSAAKSQPPKMVSSVIVFDLWYHLISSSLNRKIERFASSLSVFFSQEFHRSWCPL